MTVDDGAGFTQTATADGQGLYEPVPAGAYTISVVVSGAKIFQSRAALGPSQVLTLGVSGPPTAQSENSLTVE